MKWLYDWVDKDDPQPEATITGRRIVRLLLVVVVISALLKGTPKLLQLGFVKFEEGQREQERREKLRRDFAQLERDIRDGKVEAGEATRMLMGIDAPPPKKAADAVDECL